VSPKSRRHGALRQSFTCWCAGLAGDRSAWCSARSPLGSPGNKNHLRNAGRREFSQSIQSVAAKTLQTLSSLISFFFIFILFYLVFLCSSMLRHFPQSHFPAKTCNGRLVTLSLWLPWGETETWAFHWVRARTSCGEKVKNKINTFQVTSDRQPLITIRHT